MIEIKKWPEYAICPECGEPMVTNGTGQTLVGYFSPPGHKHDDNCRSRTYMCANKHARRVSKQNSCPACDWKGVSTCFCHDGVKLESWPKDGEIVDVFDLELYEAGRNEVD